MENMPSQVDESAQAAQCEFVFLKRTIFTLQLSLLQYYLQLQTQESAINIFLGFYSKCGLMCT